MLFQNKLQSKNGLFAVATTFLLSYFLFNDLGIRYIYGYAALGVIFLALVIKSKFQIYLSTPKFLYLIIAFVTAVYSVLPNSNFNHLVVSLTISMLMFTAYYIFMAPGERVIRRFFIVLHILAIIFSCYLFFVKIVPKFFWDYIYIHLGDYSKAFAARFLPEGYGITIGGSTTYAAYLIFIALLFNIACILKTDVIKTLLSKIFVVVTSSLYFAAIMLTNRRSEGIATVTIIAFLFVISLNLKKKKDLLKKLLIMVIALVLMVSIVLSLASCGFLSRYDDVLGFVSQGQEEQIVPEQPDECPPDEPIDEPIDEPEISADELSGGRTALWRTAFSLFLKNPVVGIGWEQFMNYNTYEHDVHNTYLQWLCEAGIIGFLLLSIPMFAIFFLTLKQTLKFAKNNNISDGAKLLNFISLGMQAFYLLVNLVDPAYYHLNFFCFFTLALVFTETAGKLEFIETGVETDCLRRKFLQKLKKLKIFY